MLGRAFGSVRSYLRQRAVDRVQRIADRIDAAFTLPAKYQGTVIEKWAKYWKQLGIDYRDVAVGVARQAVAKPLKTAVYGAVGTGAYFCTAYAPSEVEFLRQMRQLNAELVLVHESCQNPVSTQHLQTMQQYLNQGRIRCVNLGPVSLLWLDEYDDALSLYKSTCSYTRPEWLRFHERIIDIGFWHKWWKLHECMRDFDVK